MDLSWLQAASLQGKMSTLEGLMAILLSFVLALIITKVYQITYRGPRYSQSFVHTVIIMSVVASIVMIVIGNSIAVAFGLVGAFFIIRFRTAMGDPKDIAFIFFGMVTGITCGLGFYLLAILFALTLSLIIYLLAVVDYGQGNVNEKVLKITIPENMHYENVFDDIFATYLDYVVLDGVETTNQGTMLQLQYTIRSKPGTIDKDLIDAIRARNANLQVSLNMSKYRYY